MCGRAAWRRRRQAVQLGQILPLEGHPIAKLPINTQLAAYGNVAKPEFGPHGSYVFRYNSCFQINDSA